MLRHGSFGNLGRRPCAPASTKVAFVGGVAPLRLGTTLANRYRIDRLLREEGGVALYEATDTFHACLVGVKIIQRETFGDPIAFDRFKLEAWDDAAVDFGSSAGLPYFITMDWERRPAAAAVV